MSYYTWKCDCGGTISHTYRPSRDEYVQIGHKSDCPIQKRIDEEEAKRPRYWNSRLGCYE